MCKSFNFDFVNIIIILHNIFSVAVCDICAMYQIMDVMPDVNGVSRI